ncbi:hypothetical protein HDU98_007113 [Podochytrium sp. JEL0797]|nr:hypothetical protein HDU98_007113 [Podochytrium sp. JEL0797]
MQRPIIRAVYISQTAVSLICVISALIIVNRYGTFTFLNIGILGVIIILFQFIETLLLKLHRNGFLKVTVNMSAIQKAWIMFWCISHHWNTSAVVISIEAGLIFGGKKLATLSVEQLPGSRPGPLNSDKRVHPRPHLQVNMELLQEED